MVLVIGDVELVDWSCERAEGMSGFEQATPCCTLMARSGAKRLADEGVRVATGAAPSAVGARLAGSDAGWASADCF